MREAGRDVAAVHHRDDPGDDGARTARVRLYLLGALGMAIFGALFERLLIKHIYGRDVLMQLLLCYGMVLILDDVVKIVWGAEYKSMGLPHESVVLCDSKGVIYEGRLAPEPARVRSEQQQSAESSAPMC